MNLRTRLTLFITSSVIAMLVAVLVIMLQRHGETINSELDSRMDTISTAIGNLVLPSLVIQEGAIHDRAGVMWVLERTRENQPDILRIVVLNTRGEPILAYPEESPSVQGSVSERKVPMTTRGGRDYGIVQVLFDRRKAEGEQREIFWLVVGLGVVFSFFGVVAAYSIAGSITGPIERLRDGAIRFGRQEFDARVNVESADEIGVLARTFNEMAGRIEAQIRRIGLLQDRSREIAGELDRDRVLKAAVRALVELGEVSKLSIMLFNEETAQLEIAEGVGLHPDATRMVKFRIGEGIAGKVMESGKPIRVDRLGDSDEYRSFSGDRRDGSLLALPLITKGRCTGVVNLHEKRNGTNFDVSDQSFLTTLVDIIAVALENARHYELAITDGLTHLFVRRYFILQLGTEIVRTHRTAQPLSLMMVDIDHFKSVNDTYGHQTGDAVLVALAKIMKRVFREVDILSRYGGEEFALILPNTDRAGSDVVAERFRKAVEDFQFTVADGNMLTITVSSGVATYKPGRTVQEMIRDSDKALYESKRRGRNRNTHFDDIAG